ncbi:lipoyl(octanoyl) transferase LipB [Pacificimonas sp. WHA3]|uniref:Octanoyltransferase n=1 Tax=Pacificimonas pallii TaxID=2827236 RepID=A0ABS6SA04_9SPHN|nr:lipoyl(octanoyl) transferase LipB [Pacificimonas pallii]MBV7255192.1 lipoyl(octanoyl) transferase LipB [Pacificimonas pallii]
MTEWQVREGLTPYQAALDEMDVQAAGIHDGSLEERVLLVEHPPLYTAGTSAKREDLTDPDRFPVYMTGRGGQYTYHGPGQRVVYPAIDLTRHGRDIRAYVARLEGWIIDALRTFGIHGRAIDGRVGVWVDTKSGEAKIAAIGVRVRKWVTLHGFAVNVTPDLSHYGGIVPCGLAEFPVTSLSALGIDADMKVFDAALRAARPF